MRATKASLAVLGLSAVLAGGVISGAGAANAAGCEGGYPPAQCKVAISDNTVRPGEPVSFQADGFRGGESVSGDVHSVVVHVGTYSANSKGVVTGTFTVPSGLSNGTHTFTLTGLGSGVIKSARFSVTGAPAGGGNGNGNGAGTGTTTGTGTGTGSGSGTTGNGGGLAMTGTNVAGVVGGGAALVLAGGALMVATRRRKPVNAAV